MRKKCFKCGKTKALKDFYKHPMMRDGHLNKCKECNKSDVKSRYRVLVNNPEWKEKERTRGREKFHRLGYKGSGKNKYSATQASRKKFPEKYTAHMRSSKIKLNFEGAHRHHWSYNEEHYLDVIQLNNADHRKAHRFLIYDQERKMYRTLSGELLDTRDRHEEYILSMVKTMPD